MLSGRADLVGTKRDCHPAFFAVPTGGVFLAETGAHDSNSHAACGGGGNRLGANLCESRSARPAVPSGPLATPRTNIPLYVPPWKTGHLHLCTLPQPAPIFRSS